MIEETPGVEDSFARLMEERAIVPLWPNMDRILPGEPVAGYRPHHWRWADCEAMVRTSREVVRPGEGAERRSLGHVHPELRDTWSTTHTLKTAWQLLCPGEAAPDHRHTAEAVRFVLDGHPDCHTTVADQPCAMDDFSLILTPGGTWHSHFNGSDKDVIWLDGLDTPVNRFLRASFFETVRPDKAPTLPVSSDAWTGRLAPRDVVAGPRPVARYAWADTDRALRLVEEAEHTGRFSATVEYVDPLTGGSTTATMSCAGHSLRPRAVGRRHRSTESQIFVVVAGEGVTRCGDVEMEWAPRDVIVVPPWTWTVHESRGTDGAQLFSLSDRPLLDAFGLYRSEDMEG